MIGKLPNPFSLLTAAFSSSGKANAANQPAQAQAVNTTTLAVVEQSPGQVKVGQGSQQLRLAVPADFPAATRLTLAIPGSATPGNAMAAAATPGSQIRIVAADGKPLQPSIAARPISSAIPAVQLSVGTQRLPAQASISGQPGQTRITVDISASPNAPQATGQGTATAKPQTTAAATVLAPQTASARAPDTPGAPPPATAKGDIAPAARPVTQGSMPSPSPSTQVSTPQLVQSSSAKGIAMTVATRNGDGRVTLKAGGIELRLDRPTAGLRPGDGVRVQPIGPGFGDDNVDPARLRETIAGRIAQGQERMASQQSNVASKPLTSTLMGLVNQADRGHGAGREDGMAPAATFANRPGTAAISPEAQGQSSANGNQPAASVGRSLDLPMLNAGPDTPAARLHIHDENDGAARHCRRSKRFTFTIDFSELGHTAIMLDVERGQIHARIATDGFMEPKLRRELADVFGAAAELTAKPGRLTLQFARPPQVSV